MIYFLNHLSFSSFLWRDRTNFKRLFISILVLYLLCIFILRILKWWFLNLRLFNLKLFFLMNCINMYNLGLSFFFYRQLFIDIFLIVCNFLNHEWFESFLVLSNEHRLMHLSKTHQLVLTESVLLIQRILRQNVLTVTQICLVVYSFLCCFH